MKLSEGFLGREYLIDKIELDEFNIKMLRRLHMEKGSVIKVIHNYKQYPYLIELYGNRIAFEYEIAKYIEVIPYV